MSSQQLELAEQSQRLRVEMETLLSGRRVKIRLEQHEERLGWYTAGSLTLPLHQLPLLEQALEEMRGGAASLANALGGQIIPFPGLLGSADN
jgi:hypothetical protein